MSEIANVVPKELKLEVSKGIVWASRFCSNPPDDALTKEYAQAWAFALWQAKVRPEFAFEAFCKHASQSKFWPTLAEIVEIAKALSRAATVAELDLRKGLPQSEESIDAQLEETREAMMERRSKGPDIEEMAAKARKDHREGKTRRLPGGVMAPLESCVITDEDLRRRDAQVRAMRGAK